MYRGELLLFLLVVGFFSVDFLRDRPTIFSRETTLPPKITQWEIDYCTRTISIQAVTGGVPPYDFYVFRQEELDSSHWQVYRFLREQFPQLSGLPPGDYRVKAVNEGDTSPSFSTNILAVSFPSDPEIEARGSTSLCSGRSPAISLKIAQTEDSLPFYWIARVLQVPEEGDLLGYSSNPAPLLGITDTLINTGTTVAKVEYRVQARVGDCVLPTRLVEVLVDPLPRIEVKASSELVCSGTPFSISLLPKSWGSSPMQVRWSAHVLSGQVSGVSEGEGSLSSLAPISQTMSNGGTQPARIRYTFFPSFQGCEGLPESIEIEVLPELKLAPQLDLVFCSGDWVSLPVFSTNLSGFLVDYLWEVSDSTLGIDRSSGHGAQIPAFLAINAGSEPLQSRITVTPLLLNPEEGNSCSGPPISFWVTVRAPLRIQEKLSNYGGFGVSCSGAFDGKIALEVAGGMLPGELGGYTFSWTGPNGFISTSSNLVALQAGMYRVQVAIGGNCMLEKSMELTQPFSLSLFHSKVDNLCFQGKSGSISITAAGGMVPYSYAWTGPNNFRSTVANPQNLVSGTYQVTVTDANGCTITGVPQTITEPAQLTLVQSQVNTICFQGNTGSLSITATGGTAPYTYAWTGPNGFISTNEDLSTLVSGTYQVTVTDANGCTITGVPQTITEPAQLALTQSQVDTMCFQGNTGSITITAAGGTAPYSYAWTGPNNFRSTVANPQNLLSGTYQVTVTDANGCTITGAEQTITEPTELTLTQSKVDNTCFQGNTGSISITATGGTAPYTYAWTGPNNFSSSSEDLSGLVSGGYQVTVTDANNCTITGATLTITEPAQLALTQSQVNTMCFQGNTGSITVTATGGTAPYCYAWTGPNNFSSSDEDLSGLVSGSYQVTVTDANNCTITGATQTITEPTQLTLAQSQVNNDCFQGNTGSIMITAAGGTAPYTYAWTGPNGFTSTNEDLSTLVSGTYQGTVTDANGCTITGAPQTITEPPAITINAQVQSESCADASDGRIELTLSGGTPPYTLTWEHGGTDALATGLGAGTYRVRVTDQSGCSQVGEYTLLPIAPLSLQTTATLQATPVPLQISALLQATATGGTPPYTYRWSTGQSTAQITVLESGVYRIEILDSKGCSQESEVAVTLPLPMNLSLQVTTVPLCEEGGQETTVQLQLTEGLPPYQITWSRPGASTDGRVFTTRESGDFDLEVKDALGLVEKRTFILAPRLTGPLDFSYLFASQAEFQANLVGFDVNFSPQATWPFMVISWDFGDGSSSAVLNPSHRYAKKGTYLVTLTVLDDSGCLIKASQEIQVLDYFIEIPNVFTPNGDELNDTFFPKFRFIRNLQLQVMNTWGELIYRSHSQEDPGWDGLVSGQKAPEGVYVYKLRYQVPDGRTITSSSTFLLAR